MKTGRLQSITVAAERVRANPYFGLRLDEARALRWMVLVIVLLLPSVGVKAVAWWGWRRPAIAIIPEASTYGEARWIGSVDDADRWPPAAGEAE